MHGNNKTLKVILFLTLGFLSIMGGFFFSQHSKKIDTDLFHGTYLEKPREINNFSLTGTDNLAFSNQSLSGKWTILFFGFTSCGYLCPTTMAELNKMVRLLEERGVKPLPHIVMVSIDPERDSLEKLNHYVKAFNPSFYGARGLESKVMAMTNEMGIAYLKLKDPQHPSKINDIQHSGALMLFNPKGQLNAFFTSPHQARLLADDYELLVS